MSDNPQVISKEASQCAVQAAIENLSVEQLSRLCAKHGYELRRKGHRIEKHNETDGLGVPLLNCFLPHLRITASCLARTWKLLKEAKAIFHFAEEDSYGIVWERVLLLALEHIVRWLKHEIDEPEMQRAIMKLVKPLPKEEYLKKGKKQ